MTAMPTIQPISDLPKAVTNKPSLVTNVTYTLPTSLASQAANDVATVLSDLWNAQGANITDSVANNPVQETTFVPQIPSTEEKNVALPTNSSDDATSTLTKAMVSLWLIGLVAVGKKCLQGRVKAEEIGRDDEKDRSEGVSPSGADAAPAPSTGSATAPSSALEAQPVSGLASLTLSAATAAAAATASSSSSSSLQ